MEVRARRDEITPRRVDQGNRTPARVNADATLAEVVLRQRTLCCRRVRGRRGSWLSEPGHKREVRGGLKAYTPPAALPPSARGRFGVRTDLPSGYSTFVMTLATVRAGPSNGAVTTAWTCLPCLTTTRARLTNPPVLTEICAVPVQSELMW